MKNRRNTDINKRNIGIFKRVVSGETYSKLAGDYDLSVESVRKAWEKSYRLICYITGEHERWLTLAEMRKDCEWWLLLADKTEQNKFNPYNLAQNSM